MARPSPHFSSSNHAKTMGRFHFSKAPQPTPSSSKAPQPTPSSSKTPQPTPSSSKALLPSRSLSQCNSRARLRTSTGFSVTTQALPLPRSTKVSRARAATPNNSSCTDLPYCSQDQSTTSSAASSSKACTLLATSTTSGSTKATDALMPGPPSASN